MKYTCRRRWLYLREPISEDEQTESSVAHAFREVCRHLVDSDSYSGSDFSWGDREFSAAATGRDGKFGDKSRHVALSTSHHLAYLAQRAA
ncbi:hypothetical protein [Amycolatopsis sp. 195334CR]|uniref:beta family protein n=1 Tax=Amycolatopsis sp. 195334CR TaxID=2814588 RepID=UPI001A8FDE7E|nr:hypothetical protein [Amycolatopsis sp. 195334CR]